MIYVSKEVKYYKVGYTTFTFDIIDTVNTKRGVMWLGKCRENGRGAWLDANGIQFCGDKRVDAIPITNPSNSNGIGYGYTMWGGQIRDALPHGRRWYMNGGRW